MRERSILREISEIFITPERFTIHTSSRSIALDAECVVTRRSREQIEFLIQSEDGGVDLITLPMSVEGVERCRLVEFQIEPLNVEIMTQYSVECVKFSQTNNPSHSILADVAIQRLPVGLTLAQWCDSTTPFRPSIEQIYSSITLLDETLRQLRIYFKGSRGISPDSIVIGEDGLLYPTRYANMRVGQNPSDVSECDILLGWVETTIGVKREEIIQAKEIIQGKETERRRYPTRHVEMFEGHLSSGLLNEERAIIEEITGWGFVDANNRIVVEPRYLSVTPFSEGRAMVQSNEGWGLINLYGREMIPSIYESIGYNVSTGVSSVRQGDKWGYFSYMGEQLTPINIDYPNEDITHEEIAEMMAIETVL